MSNQLKEIMSLVDEYVDMNKRYGSHTYSQATAETRKQLEKKIKDSLTLEHEVYDGEHTRL